MPLPLRVCCAPPSNARFQVISYSSASVRTSVAVPCRSPTPISWPRTVHVPASGTSRRLRCHASHDGVNNGWSCVSFASTRSPTPWVGPAPPSPPRPRAPAPPPPAPPPPVLPPPAFAEAPPPDPALVAPPRPPPPFQPKPPRRSSSGGPPPIWPRDSGNIATWVARSSCHSSASRCCSSTRPSGWHCAHARRKSWSWCSSDQCTRRSLSYRPRSASLRVKPCEFDSERTSHFACAASSCTPWRRPMRLIVSAQPSGDLRTKEMRVMCFWSSSAWQRAQCVCTTGSSTAMPRRSGFFGASAPSALSASTAASCAAGDGGAGSCAARGSAASAARNAKASFRTMRRLSWMAGGGGRSVRRRSREP
jgi:hypothetical protein